MAIEQPPVSIGMPVYNGERYLREALESLLAQTYTGFELNISDNASTDRTSEICKEFASRDSRIHYHRCDQNIGAYNNFYRVFDFAKGEFFMWAAADDIWSPVFIERMLAGMQDSCDASVSFCVFGTIDENTVSPEIYTYQRDLTEPRLFNRLYEFIRQEEQDEPLAKAIPIYGLIRRSFLKEFKGFGVAGAEPWGADYLFVFYLLTRGPILIDNDCLFYKRGGSAFGVRPERGLGPRRVQPSAAPRIKYVINAFAIAREQMTARRSFWQRLCELIEATRGLTGPQRLALKLAVARRRIRFNIDVWIDEILMRAIRRF